MKSMMNSYNVLICVLVIIIQVGIAQDIKLNDFLDSVEGTKIKTKPGRHVCTTQKTISRPIPVIETYRKPVYTPKPRECPNVSSCPQYDVSYELANRTVYKLQKSSTFETNCCPGWTKQDNHEKGCMKPICKNGCGDFGVCNKPDSCECRQGYSGPLCDTDIDECSTHDHGCQHQCKNTAGSYICACQEGFDLAPDGRTCVFCFTCQKEYKDLLEAIAILSERNPEPAPTVEVDNSVQTDEIQSLNSTIAELREEVQKIKDENTKLKGQIQQLESQYETASFEIEELQNRTRTTTPAPTTPTTTTTTTTKKPSTTTTTTATTTTQTTTTTTTPTTTTTTPTTTTTRTTTHEPTAPPTEAGLQFDTYDLIVSLSNQIGLMEEKLELCQCTHRSRGAGRGFG